MQQATLEGFQLSPQQAHLWQIQGKDAGVVHQAQAIVRIEGDLQEDALRQALAAIVADHEILRTTFHRLPAMDLPLQVIDDGGQPNLDTLDWRDLPRPVQEEKLDRLLRELSAEPFDFAQAPLLRTVLVRTAAQEHRLILRMPALYADRRSLELLVDAVTDAYAAAQGSEIAAEEPIQYVDLADWQNELLESAETEAGRAYWRQQPIADLLAQRLPFDPAQDPQPFSPHTMATSLPVNLVRKVERLARQMGVTPDLFLLACWHALLGRLGGHSETVTGALFDGRKYEELQGALGLFARHLPIRIELDPQSGIDQVTKRVKEAVAERHKWQEYFDWRHLPAHNGHSAARFVPYAYEYVEMAEGKDVAGVRFTVDHLYTCIDRYHIKLVCIRGAHPEEVPTLCGACALACSQTAPRWKAVFHYDGARFPREEMARLSSHFVALLQSVVTSPSLPLDQLAVMDSNEEAEVLSFTASDETPPEFVPVHRQFEAQVDAGPGATALVFEDEQHSFAALNARANQLAHRLRTLGIGPDARAGLCLDRSAAMVTAILAVLKAGGAYVVLDPTLPPERMAAMIADAAPRVIVTESALRAQFADGEVTVLCLDDDETKLDAESTANLDIAVDGDNLAYVLFTSGSTGRPKGVAVTHANLHHYVWAAAQRLGLGAGMAYATVSTFAADLGNTVLFPALALGGALHVISQERLADPAKLADYTTRHPIDVLKIVPSHLAALLHGQDAAVLLPGRLVLGGEVTPPRLLERVRQLAPHFLIFNHYGPTETTVGVLAGPLTVETTSAVPLGRPLGQSRIYIVDAHQRPVPLWSAGELCIGGPQVSRGYLDRPGQTAERFTPDPFSPTEGARLYRTGDRARWRPGADGAPVVEFLGRLDHQVKIRGFRIELGEIEAALRAQPGVRECVVLVHGEEDPHLVAYVVAEAGHKLTSADLRSGLQARLPDYMTPTAFVQLDTLPLTANGKLDRRALPAPERAGLAGDFVAPRTDLEQTIAAIWADVLGLEQVGVHDDFFALGGHSLLATQLISHVREACQVELPLRRLFDAPTVAGMAEYVASAQPEDSALAAPPITAQERDGDLPLSFAQQRLWFLDQLEPDSAFYNISAPVQLNGQLDLDALQRTFAEIVRRHEILRTTFPTVDGKPQQVIHAPGVLDLPLIDLSDLPAEERSEQARKLATEEAHRPFDLATGPLLRLKLLRLAADEHVLILTMHHIISDGWSTGILIREVAALYTAFAQGEPSPLPDLPVQYADFARWQRDWLQGDILARQFDYWKQQLGDDLPVLQLPTDRPRPLVQRFRGAHRLFTLDATVAKRVHTLSRNEGATPFMTLLAAFKTLLHRYTGQDDIVVGSPIANRNRKAIEDVVGFFTNTLVLRTDLSAAEGSPTFRQILHRVRDVTLGAAAHQDLPFEKLVDELQPARDLSHTPLFQVVFVLQNAPRPALALPGLSLEALAVEGETAKFDLMLFLHESENGLEGGIEYNVDLFDAETIDRLMAHYQRILEEVTAAPETPISQIPLLSADERRQLVDEWNQATVTFPADRTLHGWFEQQAAQTPDAVAVTCGDEHLTYAELNARANQLAHCLRKQGVRPESTVALYLDRSVDMLVAILGVLKAGSAYVPLDPAYPHERLAFMLADSDAVLVLTQADMQDNLPGQAAPVLCLDSDWDDIAAESDANPSVQMTPDTAAYIIYTSGSTGQPKGVLVTHYNVTRLMGATHNWFHFGEDDVWTLFHSYAFDFSVWEIWGALLYGGRLVVVPYWLSRSPDAFYQLLVDEQVTVLNQTPSAFRQLIAAEDRVGQQPLALRWVIFGGEALALPSLAPWFARHGDTSPQLVNMYGITETTVHVTYRPISAEDVAAARGSVIGRAIPDLRLYILDANRQPVPLGAPGELYVGGAGVARGYRNRADLTRERFLPDPFHPGERLYRTGDLARYLPNPNGQPDIEYLGRLDDQVKIRGFRIELGEIESALTRHPGVREATVLVHERSAEDKRLVAYWVPAADAAPDAADLRSWLGRHLPDYMTPATFVRMDALPLTPNGKLDRRALPQPDVDRPDLGDVYVAPSTPTEARLAAIWAEVLGLAQVGVHDNFFQLGGDSILSIQIIARANQAGIHLTPKQIFQYQTVAEQAAAAGTTAAVHAEQGPVTGPTPLTPIQHWFFAQDLPRPDHWNQAYLFELHETPDHAALKEAVRRLIRHHDALRLRAEQTGKGWRQWIAAEDERIPFVHFDLSAVPDSEIAEAIRAGANELQRSLNLKDGPILRVALFELGNARPNRLLIAIHHLAVDGVSWRILLDDLQTLYRQLRSSEEPSLPPKTTSFQRWAERLTAYAESGAAAAELDHWLSLPTQIRPVPVDMGSGDANIEKSARQVAVALDADETQALLQTVPPVYNTQINDVLLTALAQCFAAWTGDRRLLVDLEGHGREDIFDDVDISRTVGWFTSIFPVALDLSGVYDSGERLKAVKEQLRSVPNRGIGYGILRYLDAAAGAQLRRLPQAQVSFNYLGQVDQQTPSQSSLQAAQESPGPVHDDVGRRAHLIDVRGLVTGGRLHVTFTYSSAVHRQETIQRLADDFVAALRGLIAHCQAAGAGGFTPSDFPLAQLDQDQLDDALTEVDFDRR